MHHMELHRNKNNQHQKQGKRKRPVRPRKKKLGPLSLLMCDVLVQPQSPSSDSEIDDGETSMHSFESDKSSYVSKFGE